MKVYLAARYSRIDEINGCARELEAAGHEVTAAWLYGPSRNGETANGTPASIEARPVALSDYTGVGLCDVLVSFTETPRSHASRGGRHVEFGLALAWGKRVILVGPRENVFHAMPQVQHFPRWGPEVIEAVEHPGPRYPDLILPKSALSGDRYEVVRTVAHVLWAADVPATEAWDFASDAIAAGAESLVETVEQWVTLV